MTDKSQLALRQYLDIMKDIESSVKKLNGTGDIVISVRELEFIEEMASEAKKLIKFYIKEVEA
jgi:hypothetical protein